MDQLLKEGEVLLGRYEIDSYLAEGGMQQVFRARDLAFDRLVALKVPQNTSAERRFDRSARLSARITHPNVAKTLDYFEEKEKSYLVEELVQGIDLGRFLAKFDPLDPHLAAHVIHHVSRAVAASHHVGVVHRDLKPGNILVTDDGSATTVKVTDFGIAKMAEEELSDAMEKGDDSITASKTAVGALPYMAPEMIEDSARAGKPVDIWSIGALAYRLLSGDFPFGSGLRAVPMILRAELPQRPAIFGKHGQFQPLLDELWNIISACLIKDPRSRPTADAIIATCAELGYCTAPRRVGTINRYPTLLGNYGFILSEEGEEIFFHGQSFYGPDKPEPGMRVGFAAFPGTPRHRAFPVIRLLEE